VVGDAIVTWIIVIIVIIIISSSSSQQMTSKEATVAHAAVHDSRRPASRHQRLPWALQSSSVGEGGSSDE
jgi:hypothetical protein